MPQTNLAVSTSMIGVVAHERWQIKSSRQAGLSLGKQRLKCSVSFFRSAVTGKLTHCPDFAAGHVVVNAARVRKLSRIVELLFIVKTG